MANYTMTLQTLLDAKVSLGLADYPIFDESYRTALNNKITDHFRYREIGAETPAMFTFLLNRTMKEIMPLYNQYYSSALLTFNPLYNADYTQTDNKTGSANGTTTNNLTQTNDLSTGTNGTVTIDNDKTNTHDLKDIFSETPQTKVSEIDITGDTYATNADLQHNVDTIAENGTSTTDETVTNTGTVKNTGTVTHEITNTDDYARHVSGNTGNKNYSEMLLDFRKTFINTDMMVISELENLFMGVW